MEMMERLVEKYGETMTPEDVAAVLGRHPSHVRKMCIHGELPAVKIGQRWYIVTAKLAAMLDKQGR